MMLANGQIASFSLRNYRLFLSDDSCPKISSARRTSISLRPSFGVALDAWFVKKRRDFDEKRAKSGVFSAAADGGVGTSSSTVGFLEKELSFAPSFDDYVKVMESVKTDRSKGSREEADEFGAKKKSIGNMPKKASGHISRRRLVTVKRHQHSDGSSNQEGGEISDRKGPKKNEQLEQRGENNEFRSTRGMQSTVEGLLVEGNRIRDDTRARSKPDSNGGYGVPKGEKFIMHRKVSDSVENVDDADVGRERMDSFGRRRNMIQKPREVYRYSEFGTLKNEARPIHLKVADDKSHSKVLYSGSFSKKKIGDYSDKNMWPDKGYYRTKKKELDANFRSSESMSVVIDDDYNMQNANVWFRNQNERTDHSLDKKNGLLKITDESDRKKRHKNIHIGDTKSAIGGLGDIKENSHHYLQTNKIGRRNFDDYEFEDRAAFKTFEVLTDVKNRPRVLRMEMEERIKKLANQLNATDVNMPQWQFSKMMHSAGIKFTDHSILGVVQLLGSFGNWKRVLQVVEWLQSHERFKSYKSRYIYTTVLDVLGKAKRPVESLNIFYAMQQELASYPDRAAYHCIAVTLGQAGFMKELFDVMDCMRASPEKKFKLGHLQKWDPRVEPDLVVYNAVLNACVRRKQWEGAFWVLQQLKQQYIKPSNTTYGLVMEVMLACEKYNLVYEFFKKVERSSIPGALNYKVLVNALWREGKVDEAALAVEDMERRGIVGSASLYYDLARCLCSVGRCQEALLQIDKICKVAKKPLVVTYTGLIQECLNSGSIENGAFIFSQMHKFCSPNTVTCNIMLKSYIEYGKFVEAKDLFQKMLDDSHQVISKVDLSQKAIPDKFTFNTMTEACAKMQKWDDFENAYEHMLRHGHHFDVRRHLRIVLDAFRAGKVRALELTWSHLLRYGRAPPPPIIKERFCLKLLEDDPTVAVSCIDILQDIDMHAFSEKSWSSLLIAYSHRLKNDTIVRLLHLLNSRVAKSDELQQVYDNLVNACIKFSSDGNITELAK